MNLLKFDADAAMKADDAGDRALNLSSFDCYACHHDLKGNAVRQKTGFAGKPGRVPMKSWPVVLIKLAIRELATDEADAKKGQDEFDSLVKKVAQGFDAQPFGEPKLIAAAATSLAAWADKFADHLSNKRLEKGTARKLLKLIPELYKDDRVDYDSARQIGWAVKVLSMEAAADSEGKFDPVTKTVLDKLETQLKLHLPSGKSNIEGELEARLKVLSDFNANDFKQNLGQLSAIK